MMYRQFARGMAVVVLATAAVGCEKLTTIKVDPPSASLNAVGQTQQFRATQLNGDGQPMKKPKPLTWTSDNPVVATVDGNGLVTAKKTGMTAIMASAGEVKNQAKVEVHIPAKILASDVTITGVGQTAKFNAEVADENGQPMPSLASIITVASLDPKVATVSAAPGPEQTVTAVGPGQTKLTVTAGKVTQQFNVTVKLPEFAALKVEPTELNLKVGDTSKVNAAAMANDQPVTGVPITFTSSDEKVATVDAAGMVKAVGKGKATIDAKAGDKTTSVAVTVKK